MPALDQIVNIVITQQTRAVSQDGFGLPLIVGPTGFDDADVVREYFEPSDMLDDGFETSDPEYIHAVELCSQDLRPISFLVGEGASGSLPEDIATIQDVRDDWYGLICTSKVAADILEVAAYIETIKKVYIAATADVNVPTTATGDVGSALKALGYKRTALLYNEEAADGPDAGWLGGQLPNVPGSSTYKFKQIVGGTPSVLTATKRTILIGTPGNAGKNVNIYEEVGGVNITEEGVCASGQFIDVTIGIDWLESTMKTNVYAAIVANKKIPYTDKGASVIENAVRKTIRQGVKNGLIDGDSPIYVSVPKVADVSTNDRATRVLPDVAFDCRLAGAFHFVRIRGNVSV